MKKVLSSLILLFAIIFSVRAQVPKGMGSSDPNAKKILDAVSVKFKSYKSVQAKFLLKIENATGQSLTNGNKSGTVYMKGTKYRISVAGKDGQEIYCDGTNVWTYDKASKEVTISKVDNSANSITPQKLFTNFYDKDFLYKLNGKTALNGKQMDEIELTPVDKTKAFHKVLLYVDKSVIYTTKIFEKTGNRLTYSVNSMTTTAAIPDATFVFDAKQYPGVEVVDLR